jgi:glutamate N-acetyltransferase/amino-acid N-acetyltransferase
MPAIEAGIPKVAEALSESGGVDAAEAIMTTDTVPKHCAVELDLGGNRVRIGGMSKGAGMIAPNMATMIALVNTDAAIDSGLLQELLVGAVNRSFNGITVDGDMSTNDTLIAMANGASGVEISAANISELEQFTEAFEAVCRQLARAVARDGEGATKLVTIGVRQANSEAEARQVGLAVANSNLVKTAVFGRDPNWGRILCAVGYSGVEIDPDRVRVDLCGVPIYGDGAGIEFDKDALIEAMDAAEIPIEIELGRGDGEAELYTCDFSYEYVRINAEYTT